MTTEEKQRYLNERMGALLERHKKQSPITWDDCIALTDDYIEELNFRMSYDAEHGVLYQQLAAVAMMKKLNCLMRKSEDER